MERKDFKRIAKLVLVGFSLLFLPMQPAVAQTLAPQPIQSIVKRAEASIANQQYDAAIGDYLSVLDRAPDAATSLQFAVRIAQLANATGRLQLSYDVLKPRLKSLGTLDTGLADTAQELLIEAADGLHKRNEALEAAWGLAAFREASQGAEAPATLAAQLTVSNILEAYGAPAEARMVRDKALNTLEKRDRGLYRRMLNNTAIVLQNRGNLGRAAEVFERLIASFGAEPESVELGITHFNAAILDRDRREYDAAIAHHAQAIDILERLTGRVSADTIAALGGLGQTYSFAGRPASALPPLRDAFARAKEGLGDTEDTMIQANNLADALRTLGRHDEAEPLDSKAYEWRKTNLGDAHESTLVSQKNLAIDLIGLQQTTKAAALYKNMVAIMERTRGIDHPDTVKIRRDSQMIAILTGEAPTSDASLDALSTDAKPTAETVRMANLLSGIAEKKGDAIQEERLNLLALKLSEAYYGPLHPMSIAMLTNVARNAREHTKLDATQRYSELEERLRLWSRREIASTSDISLMEEVALKSRETIGDMLSYAMSAAPTDAGAARLFSTILLEWKAVGTLERDILKAASTELKGEDKALLDRVRALQADSLKPGGDPAQADAAARNLAIAEAALAARVSGLRKLQAERNRAYVDVLGSLAHDEAVIDYIIVPLKIEQGKVEERILAMLGKSDQNVLFYDLGPAKDVDTAIPTPQDAAKTDNRQALYRTLIRPMEAKLDGIARLHVVPDGILNIVPFDGLIDPSGKALIERMDVRVVRNGRSIVGVKAKAEPFQAGKMLLVGDVDYRGVASQLPFTGAEIDAIAKVVEDAGVKPTKLRGRQASEADIRQASEGNRILHFATHGFFQPTVDSTASPLWRSGILLAGTGDVGAGDETADDGIVHAAEVIDWPLSDVDLVVLSACDTASGDRSYVEGLNGLPSALAIAGAKRSLLARWPVPDRATAIFMVAFYQHLAATQSYEAAIRNTKLDIIEGKLTGVPDELWLAFSLIEN